MFFKLIKLFCRELFVGRILATPLRFFNQEVSSIREQFSKKIAEFFLKLLLGLFVIGLLLLGCLFCFLALAIYLNEILCSTYKGYLLVGSGCVLLSAVCLLLFNLRISEK
jgi:hypothetical protein